MILPFAEIRAGLETDVLVVGAGAAGLTLASELGRAGVDVLVVESGGLDVEEEAQALNAAITTGLPHNGIRSGRARALGGTTKLWPGQSLRLRAFDLEGDSALPWSGWPLTAAELEAPYARAEAFLGIGGGEPAADVWHRARLPTAPTSGPALDFVATTYARPTDLGVRLRKELAVRANVRVLLRATAIGLQLSGSGKLVEAVEVGDPSGRRLRIAARRVVLAGGGIENPRLLLHAGIPNDNVGRFFHDHPFAACAASVDAADPRLLSDWFGVFLHGRHQTHVKLALSAREQVARRLPACSASFAVLVPDDAATNAILRLRRRALRRMPIKGAGADLARALRSGDVLAATLYRRLARGLGPPLQPEAIELLCIAEQPPDRDSRITLAADRDALGVPLASLGWRVGEAERDAVRATVECVARWFESTRLGTVAPAPWLADDDWREHISDSFHHMGATRMSDDPSRGVVDRDCRVHRVGNLFVAGSSVFPTAGYANPTLTIVALALRLADRLRAGE